MSASGPHFPDRTAVITAGGLHQVILTTPGPKAYPTEMERELRLRIVLEQPPEGVDFGLQKGRGSIFETVQKQRSGGDDLQFEFSVQVKMLQTTPSFSGPFVQGPPGGRFVYLDIGTVAGQAGSRWSRRLKIPLTGITAKMIDAGKTLEARVPGTGKDGGPSCASVKEFDGWKISARS